MNNIILIGMPSCGKSTLGVVLAKAMGMSFMDTDLLIQEAEGRKLQDIINTDGIEAFLAAEERVLSTVEAENHIIATGGSAIYSEKAMEHLRSIGKIVYIRLTIGEIKRRLNNIKTRGVAMAPGMTLDDLYAERAPLYEKYADMIIDTAGQTIEDSVAAFMDMIDVQLMPLEDADREQFILDNQEAFRFGALGEFGVRDEHFEADGEIISRETIEQSIDGGEAYRIMVKGRASGGLVVRTEGSRGELELLFVVPEEHSKGIGTSAWGALERMYPHIKVWETCTPYFEKRNINFYVNDLGFHIVEFFNEYHPDPNDQESALDGMFRFQKTIVR